MQTTLPPTTDSDLNVAVLFGQFNSPSLRRFCGVLKTTATIFEGIIVHPGLDQNQASIDEAVNAIIRSASEISKSVMTVSTAALSREHLTLLKLYATELAVWQWKNQNDSISLNVEKLNTILNQMRFEMDSITETQADALPVYVLTRLVILRVAAKVAESIAEFDFYSKESGELIELSVKRVLEKAEATARVFIDDGDELILPAVKNALLLAYSNLYSAVYRQQARVLMGKIAEMDLAEQDRFVYLNRDGFSAEIETIGANFTNCVDRVVAMVSAAVPALGKDVKPITKPVSIQPT